MNQDSMREVLLRVVHFERWKDVSKAQVLPTGRTEVAVEGVLGSSVVVRPIFHASPYGCVGMTVPKRPPSRNALRVIAGAPEPAGVAWAGVSLLCRLCSLCAAVSPAG